MEQSLETDVKVEDIAIAVATDEHWAIGKDNQLLWHLPADLKFFKQTTSGHTVIMGRKTFDSVGKALPNRRNIVISRNKNLKIEGVELVNSLEDALTLCKTDVKPIFIIGGAEIYKQSLAHVQIIYLTTVHHQFEADSYFPALNLTEWDVLSVERHEADEKNKYAYSFSVLKRK